MTFAFGDYATVTESMSDDDIINEILGHLKSIYGNNIPNPTEFLRTKWGENINAFGAYSYATNGTTSEDFNTLANSVNDVVSTPANAGDSVPCCIDAVFIALTVVVLGVA